MGTISYYIPTEKDADKTMKKSQKNAKSRRKRYDKKCPVDIGDEYKVNITEITPNGVGICRVKGFIILVNNTNPGDHVKVKITNTYSLDAEAEIVT